MESLQLSLNTIEVSIFDKQSSITCLEDLSNEIFYEIFEFLNIFDAYEAFYHLNNRFRYLFIQLSLPYKINFDLISKTTFEKCCQYVITPNIHRIISFHILNWFLTNQFLSLFTLNSSFIRLESLIFNGIKSNILISLLINLSSLSRLYSLSLTTIGIIKDPNIVHQLIFALPVLKYCNITFKWSNENFSLSNSMNKTSTIEYFITKSVYNIKNFRILLFYMPRLIRLSCSLYSSSRNLDTQKPITLNNLKYFHLNHSISFIEFEMLITNIFHQLEVLRISSINNNDYLDSNRWEKLISIHLPCLHTFNLQHIVEITNDDTYHSLIDGFNSLFWIKRQWYFTHQHYQYNDTLWIFFYSIHSNVHNLNNKNEIVFGCSHFTNINNYKITMDLYSLLNKDDLTKELVNNKLNGMISFERLNNLTVINNNFEMNQVRDLLRSSPNLQVLRLFTYSSECSNNNNNIQHIIICKHLILKNVQELINTYPYLKTLEMNISECDLELIIRFLLKNNSRLYMLAFRDSHPVMINRLKKLIDREELVRTYSIEYISDTAYLWW